MRWWWFCFLFSPYIVPFHRVFWSCIHKFFSAILFSFPALTPALKTSIFSLIYLWWKKERKKYKKRIRQVLRTRSKQYEAGVIDLHQLDTCLLIIITQPFRILKWRRRRNANIYSNIREMMKRWPCYSDSEEIYKWQHIARKKCVCIPRWDLASPLVLCVCVIFLYSGYFRFYPRAASTLIYKCFGSILRLAARLDEYIQEKTELLPAVSGVFPDLFSFFLLIIFLLTGWRPISFIFHQHLLMPK